MRTSYSKQCKTLSHKVTVIVLLMLHEAIFRLITHQLLNLQLADVLAGWLEDPS